MDLLVKEGIITRRLIFQSFCGAAPAEKNNGFIYAKVYGGFEKIRTSVGFYCLSRILQISEQNQCF